MKKFALVVIPFLGILVCFSSCDGQPLKSGVSTNPRSHETEGGIKWMSFEQAIASSGQNPKKIFIDIYTDWCGWCKRMDQTTFREDSVILYMNDNYYNVKLNAETRDTITFKDMQFKYAPQYKANELAVSLLNGKMGYPSYVILDEGFTMLTQPVQSYLSKDNLMPILQFFGEKIYLEKSWEQYQTEIKGPQAKE